MKRLAMSIVKANKNTLFITLSKKSDYAIWVEKWRVIYCISEFNTPEPFFQPYSALFLKWENPIFYTSTLLLHEKSSSSDPRLDSS